MLLDLTLQNLDKIFSHRKRLTRKGIFEQINDFDKEKYKKCVKNELAILERIKFDGYMYLLFELSNYAKERNIFCEFFGSIQYSLSAYLLGITSSC